jgi:hypothetical protein
VKTATHSLQRTWTDVLGSVDSKARKSNSNEIREIIRNAFLVGGREENTLLTLQQKEKKKREKGRGHGEPLSPFFFFWDRNLDILSLSVQIGETGQPTGIQIQGIVP